MLESMRGQNKGFLKDYHVPPSSTGKQSILFLFISSEEKSFPKKTDDARWISAHVMSRVSCPQYAE